MARFSWRNRLFRNSRPSTDGGPKNPVQIVVGAQSGQQDTLKAFDNSTITYSSQLASVQYDSILRDKQANINTLYQLADYYTDADPIVRGVIKGVYVPFTCADWYLTGKNEKTIELFEQHYKNIRLREHMADIFLQYFKYNNVFVYIWQGNIMTLPPHKCKIGNTALNGNPVVDFDVMDISNEFRQRTYSVLKQKGLDDDSIQEIVKKTYPPEVAKAINGNFQYAQLDPQNVYVLQGNKQGWTRYAVPWIASALPALAKKQLITKYETAQLNIGARPFVHTTYGDPKQGRDMLPDFAQLSAVRRIISSAMSGTPLAVTNHLANCKVIQADLSSLYQWPLYEQVNADILAAGGIAGIIVNGQSQDGSTFASAQISMQAAAARIEAARKQFEDFMNKLNQRLVEDIRLVHTNNLKELPQFHFAPLDMAGQKALRETCIDLWQKGVISTRTMMEHQGYSIAKEKARRDSEASDGSDESLMPRQVIVNQSAGVEAQSTSSNSGKVGRPTKSDEQRGSDPQNAIRSKQSKEAADGDMADSG